MSQSEPRVIYITEGVKKAATTELPRAEGPNTAIVAFDEDTEGCAQMDRLVEHLEALGYRVTRAALSPPERSEP